MATQPRVVRPTFPDGYLQDPQSFLDWQEVEQKLEESIHYWLSTVRPNGRPHSVPKWAVWVEGKIYFDGSPETRHARNIAQNPFVSLHLESGANVVIVEGKSKAIEQPDRELAHKIAVAYRRKYGELGYAPDDDQWDNGGLFMIQPQTVIAWTSFTEDPTKFIFVSE